MLAVQNIRIEFGARVLFSDLSFSVRPKERISFAGHNGAGKSSLMKAIAGILPPAEGQISHPKGYRIGYLPQEGIHLKGVTLFDQTLTAFSEATELQKKIDSLSAELEDLDPRSSTFSQHLNRIGELELQLDSFEPTRIRSRVESVLFGLGFQSSDLERDCGEFSGGWQMRIAMAKLFLSEPDCLLLDEPTNHLDVTSQYWVESYLRSYPGATIIISHDLALLDSLTTRTIAFHHGRAEEYAGNYSYYLKESVLRKEILKKQQINQQREIQKTKDFINRFRAQATKASQVQSRIKQLAKVELIEIESDDAVMNFRFPSPPNSTQNVAALENVTKTYGTITVFSKLNLLIQKGEKIAVVGPNGAGKSTFCRLITGEEAPTEGNHILGTKTLPSFFNQNHADELDPKKTVLETVEEALAGSRVSNSPQKGRLSPRDILGCFLFKNDDVFKKVGVLSGGERSRVALVRMLLRPANFLILDEPTNHLDVQSQEILQQAIRTYEGTVLIVSHNRFFLDPIVQKTIEFRPNHPPRLFSGNITYYLEKTQEENATSSSSRLPVSSKTSALTAAPQPNRKEQKRREALIRQRRSKELKPLQENLATLEKSITELEAAQGVISQRLSHTEVADDPEKLRETTNAYQALQAKLETTISRWSALSSQVDKLEGELS